jgi:hypothetical protein
MMMDPLSERDLILLNSYLDGEMSAAERSAFEARLAGDAALRRTLNSLRATVALLGMAERVQVPRSFTLDPAVYRRRMQPGLLAWPRLSPMMQPVLAGASLTLSALMCAGALLLSGQLSTPGASAPLAAEAPVEEEIVMMEAAADEGLAADAAEAQLPAPAQEAAPAEEPMAAAEEAAAEARTGEPMPGNDTFAATETAGASGAGVGSEPVSTQTAAPMPTNMPEQPQGEVAMPSPESEQLGAPSIEQFPTDTPAPKQPVSLPTREVAAVGLGAGAVILALAGAALLIRRFLVR